MQVVETTLGIVIVPAVTEGIRVTDVLIATRGLNVNRASPCIVVITNNLRAASVTDANDVTLQILLVIVILVIIRDLGQPTVCVIAIGTQACTRAACGSVVYRCEIAARIVRIGFVCAACVRQLVQLAVFFGIGIAR